MSVAQLPPPPHAYVAAGSAPFVAQPVLGQQQPTGVPGSAPASHATYPPGYGPPAYGSPPGMATMGVTYSQNPNVRIDEVLHLALAPWWKRFLALLIDSMVLGVAVFIVVAIIGAATRHPNSSTSSTHTLTPGQAVVGFIGIFVLLSIPYMLYFGIMNGSKRGQTLGKMALNIVVRDARTGGPIGFWRGVGRYAITVVFYVVLLVPYIIDNLSPLWDARRQAWHDKVVHSVVVDRNP